MMAAIGSKGVYFRVGAPTFAAIVSSLPLFGFMFGVTWSIFYNFEASTQTHCGVKNYLPSISASIGGFTPQRYVWRICIALHAAPRLIASIAYYNLHSSREIAKDDKFYQYLVMSAFISNLLENAALLGLTYVSSSENYHVHEKSFILFLVCSLIYMVLTCILQKWGSSYRGRHMTIHEKKSLQYKLSLFLSNISCCLLAGYVFYRHNKYCESGVYSIFAFIEYLTVICNIGFHYTAYLDFADTSLSLVNNQLVVVPKTS